MAQDDCISLHVSTRTVSHPATDLKSRANRWSDFDSQFEAFLGGISGDIRHRFIRVVAHPHRGSSVCTATLTTPSAEARCPGIMTLSFVYVWWRPHHPPLPRRQQRRGRFEVQCGGMHAQLVCLSLDAPARPRRTFLLGRIQDLPLRLQLSVPDHGEPASFGTAA